MGRAGAVGGGGSGVSHSEGNRFSFELRSELNLRQFRYKIIVVDRVSSPIGTSPDENQAPPSKMVLRLRNLYSD